MNALDALRPYDLFIWAGVLTLGSLVSIAIGGWTAIRAIEQAAAELAGDE